MDIQGLGEAVVKQLVELKLVKNFADIYNLKAKDLSRLELFKEKKINNILSAIQKSKAQPLSRLIYALGIRHVGQKAAYVLAQQFKSMDKLLAAKKEDLDKIYEVGPAISESIVDYFSLAQTKKIIQQLKNIEVNLEEKNLEAKVTLLTGKNIVFTGELKGYSRSGAEDLVRKAGGNATSSVSKNTDFVVAGDSPGSKYDKAKKLGIKIIDESKFKEMIS
jgi:DNA ligase (NAD+)